MRLTIIVPDGTVGIDGEFRNIDLATLDTNLRALQWNGTTGHLEFNDGTPNEIISDISTFNEVVAAWNALTPPPPEPPTLEELKAEKTQQLNWARNVEEATGFSYLNKVFDSDPLSVQRISIAAQTAQLDPNFVIGWTAQDNTIVQLNQNQMLAMPAALAMHAYALHEKARQLKDQVSVAPTEAALNAIVWS